MGYLLAFGTVLAKMWRVYHIFHNPSPRKMVSVEVVCSPVATKMQVSCWDSNELLNLMQSSSMKVKSLLHDTMSQGLNGVISTDLQKLKDWHLVIAVLGVTAVGVALLVTRSALLPKQPKLIKDSENSEGRTVRKRIIVLFEFSCFSLSVALLNICVVIPDALSGSLSTT